MLRSDWTNDGIIYSDMRVEKQTDGRFKASFPAAPQVPAALGRDESEAINLAKASMQEAHAKGTVGS